LGLHPTQVRKNLLVESDDMVELSKVLPRHLPRAAVSNVHAILGSNVDSPPIRGPPDVPIAGTGRIDLDVEAQPLRLAPKRGLG
jgi:hypothetical protein